ncbi:MAG: SMP-30/gluconolactonase/LRE family protein [Chitinophagaceae bacterium]
MKSFYLLLILFTFILKIAAQPSPVIIQTKSTNTLVPEGIAVDKKTGDIYVTSIAGEKIIVIKKDGSHKDFIATRAAGFAQGLGIKIDEKRNLVWAVSNRREDKWFISQAHVFDKISGKSKQQFSIKDTVNHFFNDLVLDDKGNAYITATYSGKLFYANRKTNAVNVFLSDSLLQYPNGIELQHNKLYVATYSNGLLVYDLQQEKLGKLEGYTNKTYAYNLDGIGLYNNSLYGVFNTDSLNANNAIIEYKLNEKGSAVVQEKIVQKGHPLFHEPTTLAIAGNQLYVLANSHLAVYNKNKESIKGVEKDLSPVTVLVYQLD